MKSHQREKFDSWMEPLGSVSRYYDDTDPYWQFGFLDRLVQIQYVRSRELYSFSLWFQGSGTDDNFIHTMFHAEEEELEIQARRIVSEWFTYFSMKRVHSL